MPWNFFRLTELLAKDSTNHDPGRVINISSVAGINPNAEGSYVSSNGTGLWSCKSFVLDMTPDIERTSEPDNTSKAAGSGVFYPCYDYF